MVDELVGGAAELLQDFVSEDLESSVLQPSCEQVRVQTRPYLLIRLYVVPEEVQY